MNGITIDRITLGVEEQAAHILLGQIYSIKYNFMTLYGYLVFFLKVRFKLFFSLENKIETVAVNSCNRRPSPSNRCTPKLGRIEIYLILEMGF